MVRTRKSSPTAVRGRGGCETCSAAAMASAAAANKENRTTSALAVRPSVRPTSLGIIMRCHTRSSSRCNVTRDWPQLKDSLNSTLALGNLTWCRSFPSFPKISYQPQRVIDVLALIYHHWVIPGTILSFPQALVQSLFDMLSFCKTISKFPHPCEEFNIWIAVFSAM